jgi:hypothetical protein
MVRNNAEFTFHLIFYTMQRCLIGRWLFPKLKNVLKGQSFADIPDIQRKLTTLLRGIPENDFQDCFWQWHHRLTKCIASQGEYFEGESSR